MYQNGQVEMQTCHVDRRYQLITNVFQCTILSLFNFTKQLTVREISSKSGIDMKSLTPHLIALCNPKHKILKKEVNKPTLTAEEKIEVNSEFKNNNVRISLIPAQA